VDELYGFGTRRGFSDHREIMLPRQHRAKTVTHQRVVVRDHDPYRRCGSGLERWIRGFEDSRLDRPRRLRWSCRADMLRIAEEQLLSQQTSIKTPPRLFK